MPQVEFYSLEPGSRGDRFLMACQIVERLYEAGKRILILCPDRDEARHLDRLLWTFKQESFIPHGLVGAVDASLTPIMISLDGLPSEGYPSLLNLGRDLPSGWERFEQIIDLVDLDPEVREAGRARYRAYRQGGYEPIHQPLSLNG
ncbi:DNA polymerase III subunit chi [Caldichromatium japonicum]|uniref:DNA polymerase III subunit chi n=1 Tax=Caldichromatium japonicum TaxID=2699430 RepID=A0A6G7VE33_9GAMM|nr:DNA polymerase III subunit chi [Caldichromatium japonicum]QIK38212.1 DNA polymerase III subunit chi [Caldichromatium japonicum]